MAGALLLLAIALAIGSVKLIVTWREERKFLEQLRLVAREHHLKHAKFLYPDDYPDDQDSL